MPMHLVNSSPAAFWRWEDSGRRNRGSVFSLVHLRCFSRDRARGKPMCAPMCAPSVHFLRLQRYSLLSQLFRCSAATISFRALSKFWAPRSFSDLRSELTFHSFATDLSGKPDVGCFCKYLCLWESGSRSVRHGLIFFPKFSVSSLISRWYKVHIYVVDRIILAARGPREKSVPSWFLSISRACRYCCYAIITASTFFFPFIKWCFLFAVC